MVTKTLNDAFGYDGWCLEVKNTTREEPLKDDKGRYHVAYIATVRITHRRSGVFRGEFLGVGEASRDPNAYYKSHTATAPKRTAAPAMRLISA